MPRITATDGVEISYTTATGADPILLVHGFASTAELNWVTSGWVRTVADAGRGAILVDLRGHGASDAPSHSDAYSPEQLAADLIAVLDNEKLARVDVIGYSMGAQTVRVLAATYPQRVHKIVLGGIGSNEQFATWGIASLMAALDGDDAAVSGLAADLVQVVKSGAAMSVPTAKAIIQGMTTRPITAMPQVPTLVVAGEKDEVAAHAPQLAAALGAQLEIIPRRNHRNAVTARAFKQAVMEFLHSDR